MKGNSCIYFPYKDPYLVSAQVFSVLAFSVSWVWFATTSLSFLTMALFQGLWFCRQEKISILFYTVLAIGSACLAIFTGTHILEEWEDSSFCIPFFMVNQNNDPNYSFNCNEQRFAYISFACGGLWILASLALMLFVCSGNYDVWEKKYNALAGDDSDSEIDASAPSARMTPSRDLIIKRQTMKKQPSVAAMMMATSIAMSNRSQERTVDTSATGGPIPVATPVQTAQPSYVGSERGRMDSYV